MKKNKYKVISNLISDIKLEEKHETGYGYHGGSKDEEFKYTLYWDEYHHNWTTKEMVLKGCVFNRLSPIIYKLIKEYEKE